MTDGDYSREVNKMNEHYIFQWTQIYNKKFIWSYLCVWKVLNIETFF